MGLTAAEVGLELYYRIAALAGDALHAAHKQALLDYNRRFHLAIARASRNERLARLVERSLDEMMRPIATGYPADQHGAIVAAFRTGDPARARAAVVDHILMTQERVLKREGLRS